MTESWWLGLSVFPALQDARLWGGVSAVRPRLQRGCRVHRQLVRAGGELVLAVEHLVVGHDLPGVDGHAAHRGHEAGCGAAFGLIVGLVVANGVDQFVPLDLIGVRFRLGEGPDEVVFGEVLALVDAALDRRKARAGSGKEVDRKELVELRVRPSHDRTSFQ